MAKVEHTSDARVLVGIDISKHRHEVLMALPGKTRRRRLTITNSADDFMRLIGILREYGLPSGSVLGPQATITSSSPGST
ncbi:hypothetical protein SAMN04487993_10142 [Salipiger marinus]|uniref:Transposase n=1 Tax=Salipiger marinus TaxID=555512 RepID=A0A1G8Q018_9RHOB|nr:hypothetical protein SAMN04487993_10142 [Salipiger marinus]